MNTASQDGTFELADNRHICTSRCTNWMLDANDTIDQKTGSGESFCDRRTAQQDEINVGLGLTGW